MNDTFNLDDILSFNTEFDNNPNTIGDGSSPIIEKDNTTIIETEGEGEDDSKDDDTITDKKDDSNESDNTDDSDKPEETPDALKVYYNFLTESNLIQPNEDFKFDGTEESLNAAKKQTIEKYQKSAYESLWAALSDEIKPIVEYAVSGGTDLKSFWKDTSVQDYDLDNESDQVQILKEYYKETTKFNEDRINKIIKTFKDNDELSVEAFDALDSLKEIKEQKKTQTLESIKQQKIAEENQANEYRNNIAKTIDELAYIPKERRGKVKAFIFNPITKGNETLTDYQRAFKSLQNNPEHLAQLADLLMDYSPEKGLSYERFKTKGRSEATNDFKKRLEQATSDIKPNQSTKKSSGGDSSTFDWRAFLEH